MLEIKNITKSFKKGTFAVDNFSFNFEKGIYALLGPNGSGKSTLLRCISNVYPSHEGAIIFDGKNILDNKNFFKKIGYLSQTFGTFKDLSVKEVMSFFAYLKGIEKRSIDTEVNYAIEKVNLYENINDKINSLSGGMMRRLGIAQAIIGEPKIILLDEPMVGLDPKECLEFKNVMRELKNNAIIIISTHDIESIETLCDYVIVINKGELIDSGSPKKISQHATNKVYIIPSEDERIINGKYMVEKRYVCNDRSFLRILSNEKQNYSTINPTLEDSYLCLIENI